MNTIVLMGRLARDPETKLTSTQKGQTKVSRFPLVVKRNRTIMQNLWRNILKKELRLLFPESW